MNLAEILSLTVVAEGVETREQQEVLLELGVQYAQGFGLMRPAELQDLLAALQQR